MYNLYSVPGLFVKLMTRIKSLEERQEELLKLQETTLSILKSVASKEQVTSVTDIDGVLEDGPVTSRAQFEEFNERIKESKDFKQRVVKQYSEVKIFMNLLIVMDVLNIYIYFLSVLRCST